MGVTTANAVYDWTTVEREQDLGFYSLLYLSQALQHRASSAPCEVLIVSNEMESVARREQAVSGKATLLGWVKVASQEFTALRGKSVDIVLPPAPRGERVQGSWQHERLITQLCEELAEGESALAGTDPSRIAYRGDQRFMRGYTPVVLPEVSARSSVAAAGGTYLINGGLGASASTSRRILPSRCKPGSSSSAAHTCRSAKTGMRGWPEPEDRTASVASSCGCASWKGRCAAPSCEGRRHRLGPGLGGGPDGAGAVRQHPRRRACRGSAWAGADPAQDTACRGAGAGTQLQGNLGAI